VLFKSQNTTSIVILTKYKNYSQLICKNDIIYTALCDSQNTCWEIRCKNAWSLHERL